MGTPQFERVLSVGKAENCASPRLESSGTHLMGSRLLLFLLCVCWCLCPCLCFFRVPYLGVGSDSFLTHMFETYSISRVIFRAKSPEMPRSAPGSWWWRSPGAPGPGQRCARRELEPRNVEGMLGDAVRLRWKWELGRGVAGSMGRGWGGLRGVSRYPLTFYGRNLKFGRSL